MKGKIICRQALPNSQSVWGREQTEQNKLIPCSRLQKQGMRAEKKKRKNYDL